MKLPRLREAGFPFLKYYTAQECLVHDMQVYTCLKIVILFVCFPITFCSSDIEFNFVNNFSWLRDQTQFHSSWRSSSLESLRNSKHAKVVNLNYLQISQLEKIKIKNEL